MDKKSIMVGPTLCRNCGYKYEYHLHGGPCHPAICKRGTSCPGWDPRGYGEPSEPTDRLFRGQRLSKSPGDVLVTIVNKYPEAPAWEHALPPRLDLWNHSPTGFEWGYLGSGPAQLALAVLAMCVHDEDAVRLHQRFKQEFVAKIAREGNEVWEIEEWEVVEWHLRQLALERDAA